MNEYPKGSGPAEADATRAQLAEALRLSLVGPRAGDALAEERLPGWERPSSWYLTGFLIPAETAPEKRGDADEKDEFEDVPESAAPGEETGEDRKAAKPGFFPSSMGLSFLVPKETASIDVLVRWGDYSRAKVEEPEEKPVEVWQREPREEKVLVPLDGHEEPRSSEVPGSGGLRLVAVERSIQAEGRASGLPAGTRAVSLFLVNQRAPAETDSDLAFAFQAELEVRSEAGFVPRSDPRGAIAADWDEQVADLHYAEVPEFASGHGVSAQWELDGDVCRVLRTTWIPSAEVEKTDTVDVPEVERRMKELGVLGDGAAAEAALRPLVAHYRTWIAEQSRRSGAHSGTRRETAEELVRLAGVAADRIERGIALLAADPVALDAFKVANRAVARALEKRIRVEEPSWRTFQLAFLLLNLPGLADPSDPDRQTVELLFFPTGGGKTEAYLGLAAFAMVLRRLRHPGDGGRAGAGVSVIMRYTLRLLTLDQLVRAAGLVCALELERGKDPGRYGDWPFEIGLWVGKAATPNIMGRKGDKSSDSARTKVRQFKRDPKNKPSPIPLEECPWCGTRFAPESFSLVDDKGRANEDAPTHLVIRCTNIDCDFTRDRALPIVAVDEPIYRRLPAFLIATVDKFAALPWVGPAGAILGGAERHDMAGFFGAAEPGRGKRLAAPLPPPDLVIQDELHLISGPLGTMAGLYEAAIEALATRTVDGHAIRPKIVASTATVRRAQDQIQALFGRSQTQIFPPPGPDRRDSFFAHTVPAAEKPARLYLGIAAQGRNPKAVMRRTYLALMGAAEKLYRDAGGHRNESNPVDPYMTVLGYFNSLRELGGARRILEEEVQNTLKSYGSRRRIGEACPMFQDRKTFSEVVELTSRVSTDKVAEARRRLEALFHATERVDCAIATNMISVGLDIPRLGLMVVVGQPKTHAEYIQATSRVGRDDAKPGLVVTLFNIHKPRDRSHFEHFRHYHETFYRSVEVGSVTPFSPRALDRGFAGALVGLARHLRPELSAPEGAGSLAAVRAELEKRLLDVFETRVRQQPIADPDERAERLRSVHDRVVDLLDSWRKVLEDYRAHGIALKYAKNEGSKEPKPLLREMLDEGFDSEHHRKFRVSRSLRDVEPAVNLFLRDLSGAPVEENS